jgi:hypothetical protein
MSSIKLTADSGGGTFEIKAPSSSSNTRVLTLPDTGNITVPDTNGITMADQWRLSVDRNVSGGSEIIDANWERNDGGYFSQIGTGMTQSSGIFTFPATGIYFVAYNLTMYSISLTQRYSGAVIQVTTNNSSYAAQATSYFNAGVSNGSGCYMNGICHLIIDVTDTSTHKVRFIAQSATPANNYVAGNSNEQITGVTFIRLGDT